MNSGKPISKPDLYVLARIIKVLKEQKKLNRTTLATHTGLSYDRFVKYLKWMTNKGFVEVDSDGEVFLTKLGVETYDRLVNWILKYVGKVRFPKFSE
ncbi:MAG: winged helix-turn-helix domain-containing protein [Candidatus Bathyarchaeum tardum]|nr:MAG: winged helix-turn-helix domain-containing protein [Candidatus Bathyarchaeum tardum]